MYRQKSSYDHYRPARTDQPGALVLPLTLPLNLLGRSTQADCQAAGGSVDKHLAAYSFINPPLSSGKSVIVFSVPVTELPTSGGRLVVFTPNTCPQSSIIPFHPDQPLIAGPGKEEGEGEYSHLYSR